LEALINVQLACKDLCYYVNSKITYEIRTLIVQIVRCICPTAMVVDQMDMATK